MKFELWRGTSGAVALAEELDPDEKETLEELGYRLIESFEAACELEATERFIEWCQKRQPDAKVAPASQEMLHAQFLEKTQCN